MKSPQINLNTVKDVLKKLSFLKNNMALLVPILIVIVAALLFIPTKLLSARLKRTITEQSVKTATKIDSLIRDVNEAGQAEAMEEYLSAYAQDPCHMETLMEQTTQRELLSYRLFPDDPNENSPLLFEPFRRAFLSGIDAMIERLGAGGPPADADIKAALEKSRGPSLYGRGGAGAAGGYDVYGMGGAMGGMGGGYRMMPETDRKIFDKICEDRARTLRLYASPADLEGYSFWSDWKFEKWNLAVRQCWYWQLGYWALEDVTDTILAVNQSGSSVLDAPVKRIMSVSFALSGQGMTRMIGARRGRGGRRTAEQQMPQYVINLKSAMAAPPCTGRYCDAEAGVDVMHFGVRVLVSADHVMSFIQELCSAKTHKFRGWHDDQPEQTFKHNQITVLEHTVAPIDLEDPEHASYRYGPGAVVDLDLVCEYLFVNAGYDEIKSEVIKNDLQGISDEEAGI